jgi:hypothetical protein
MVSNALVLPRHRRTLGSLARVKANKPEQSAIPGASLSEDLEAPKIILAPARLVVDHAAERLRPKGATWVME